MAQLVHKNVSSPDHPIVLSTYTLIPGLTATIMTGAGWIILDFNLNFTNSTGDAYHIYARLSIDGVAHPLSVRDSRVPNGLMGQLAMHYPVHLGSGQHVISVEAQANLAGYTVTGSEANLTIEEPGY